MTEPTPELPSEAPAETPGLPVIEPEPSQPDQLWIGEWTPAPDQPVDALGRYLPFPTNAPPGPPEPEVPATDEQTGELTAPTAQSED